MASVGSSCSVKQAFYQPEMKKKKQLFLDITRVPFLLFCPLCSLQCSTPPTPGCWIYKGITIQNSDIYGPEASRDSSHACCCGTCTKLFACVRKEEGYVETTFLISSFFCLALSKATDTPEDRNNPVLLYNKMELGDLNANFSLEVDLQVKKNKYTCTYTLLLTEFAVSLSAFFLSLIFIPLRCLFLTCPEAVQLELLHRQNNEHSQHQRS